SKPNRRSFCPQVGYALACATWPLGTGRACGYTRLAQRRQSTGRTSHMTVRRDAARPKRPWDIDIPYRTPEGRRKRYRSDAQVQTRTGADAEHRRRLSQIARFGEITPTAPTEANPASYTVLDAISHFRRVVGPTLTPSTLRGYDEIIDSILLQRWRDLPIAGLGAVDLRLLDADLAGAGLSASRRRNVQVATRSILRAASRDGLLDAMPELPSLPKVGRSSRQAMLSCHVDTVLANANGAAALAFSIIAFAGLRPCEVRGLRWPDVDMEGKVIRVRRGV